jgi:hypothetical protein
MSPGSAHSLGDKRSAVYYLSWPTVSVRGHAGKLTFDAWIRSARVSLRRPNGKAGPVAKPLPLAAQPKVVAVRFWPAV